MRAMHAGDHRNVTVRNALAAGRASPGVARRRALVRGVCAYARNYTHTGRAASILAAWVADAGWRDAAAAELLDALAAVTSVASATALCDARAQGAADGVQGCVRRVHAVG